MAEVFRKKAEKAPLAPPTIEDDPYVGTSSEKVEIHPQPHPDLVEKYSLFADYFKPNANVVYHPCGSNDVSPSAAFPGSRVIYADIADDPMQALRAAGFEAHTASALEYDPGPVDILVMLNPQISPKIPASHVKHGGYVLCNDYHGTARTLRNDSEFEFVGVVLQEGTKKVVDTHQLEDYWKEIETEEEFRRAPFNWGSANYIMAKKVVEKVTGQSENVLEEYRKIIDLARKQHRESTAKLRAQFPDQEDVVSGLESERDLYTFVHNGKQYIVDARMARRKGTVDDIFVFRKK